MAHVGPAADPVGRDELAADPPLAPPAGDRQQAGEVPGVVDVPVRRADNQDGPHVVHAAGHGQGIQASAGSCRIVVRL